ncbi:MAG: GGDEF domain-containing protein [Sulfurimonadaceae bacterium]|jgi:diguanylate cyclase (GGDEF)-like protein|nr:GGDEF domain-containing protein [Sulfurimonadaceae bacterium]
MEYTIDKNVKIYDFILISSSEVDETVRAITEITDQTVLIHITSYIHNTVLVQNLKMQLEKKIPHGKIILIKSDDKTKTLVTLFAYKEKIEQQELSDKILQSMHEGYKNQNESLKKTKTDLLSRYFTDNLTHLPNIYQLRKDLQENEEAGLVVINIDNLRTINNFYGFNVGDYVIENVALLLGQHLQWYQLYRTSVDEFAFILERALPFYELKVFLSDLYEAIRMMMVTYQGSKIFVDFTLASSSSVKNENIFSKVSMALQYAKDKSLPFWIYEERMQFENQYEINLQLSNTVRQAIENKKIVPYFQSIIDNKTLQITKFECLARLIDENNNVIAPNLFLPIAKRIKADSLVTKIIIDKSMAVFLKNDFEFSINLSIDDILNNEMYLYIIEKLKNYPNVHRITFELLESEAGQDFNKVESFINEVKRYGAKIAIDDFGSGYSNFSFLSKVGVDYIKIDGSLITQIEKDKNALLVVETIVEFAKKLGIQTIAEHVYTSTIMDKVKELGIDYSQGFYIDEPTIDFEKIKK